MGGNYSEESNGIELIVQWNVLDNLRLTGMTTYREPDAVLEPYYDAAGELQGGEKESSDARNDYTLRFDWNPQVPVGDLLVHVDCVFQEAENEDPLTWGVDLRYSF